MIAFVIEIFLPITSLFFGILAATKETKDKKTKKINKYGKIAIFGIILTSLLNIGNSIFKKIEDKKNDTIKLKKEIKESKKRELQYNETILYQKNLLLKNDTLIRKLEYADIKIKDNIFISENLLNQVKIGSTKLENNINLSYKNLKNGYSLAKKQDSLINQTILIANEQITFFENELYKFLPLKLEYTIISKESHSIFLDSLFIKLAKVNLKMEGIEIDKIKKEINIDLIENEYRYMVDQKFVGNSSILDVINSLRGEINKYLYTKSKIELKIDDKDYYFWAVGYSNFEDYDKGHLYKSYNDFICNYNFETGALTFKVKNSTPLIYRNGYEEENKKAVLNLKQIQNRQLDVTIKKSNLDANFVIKELKIETGSGKVIFYKNNLSNRFSFDKKGNQVFFIKI